MLGDAYHHSVTAVKLRTVEVQEEPWEALDVRPLGGDAITALSIQSPGAREGSDARSARLAL